MDKTERIKMVKAMEFICRHINNEDVFEGWLMNGVADGDIKYGDLSDATSRDEYYDIDYYTEDESLKDLMGCFLRRMAAAKKSGGLLCDGIVDGD